MPPQSTDENAGVSVAGDKAGKGGKVPAVRARRALGDISNTAGGPITARSDKTVSHSTAQPVYALAAHKQCPSASGWRLNDVRRPASAEGEPGLSGCIAGSERVPPDLGAWQQ